MEYVDENGGTLAPGILESYSSNKYYHGCAMKLNNTHVIIAGGSYTNGLSLIINIYEGNVTDGPGIVYSRRNHGCERFKHSNGTEFLIIGK